MADPGHNIVPFGRSDAERLANLKRALNDAETAAAQQRHPSGAVIGPWASEKYPSAVERRRAMILGARPRCKVCERPWAPGIKPPPDAVCRACLDDMARNGPADPPADPALF